jgi:hypothetical protein
MKKNYLKLLLLFCVLQFNTLYAQLPTITIDVTKERELERNQAESDRQYAEKKRQEYKQKKNIENAKEFGKYALLIIILIGGYTWFTKTNKENEKRKNLDIAIKLLKEGASDDYVEKISKSSIVEIQELRKQTSNSAS